jgi:hypothetical protein
MGTHPLPGGAPARKKTSPLVWILVGLVAFFMLAGILVLAGGLFIFHKAKQAGLDPDMIQKNPALAAVNLALSANPEIEKISIDEDRGTITVREKKTGKVMTLDFKDAQEGRFSFTAEGKETVSIEAKAAGSEGSVEIRSGEGSARFGSEAAANVPAWLPAYPGVRPEGAFSARASGGESGTYHFRTADAAERVVSFYEAGLKKAGLEVDINTLRQGGTMTTSVLSGESAGRTVQVTIVPDEGGGTGVTVGFESKK